MTTLAKRLTADDVAKMAGVKRDTITGYHQRGYMPKPEPCPTCGQGSTWALTTIKRWLAQRAARAASQGKAVTPWRPGMK